LQFTGGIRREWETGNEIDEDNEDADEEDTQPRDWKNMKTWAYSGEMGI